MPLDVGNVMVADHDQSRRLHLRETACGRWIETRPWGALEVTAQRDCVHVQEEVSKLLADLAGCPPGSNQPQHHLSIVERLEITGLLRGPNVGLDRIVLVAD